MITFCEYMDRRLYGPAGYYSTGAAKSGKEGDYFTAPDVGPAMGQLLAEIFLGWKEKLEAETFSVIEAGAGEGRLAEDIMRSHPFHYLALERSEERRKHLAKIHDQWPNFEVYPDLSAIKGKSLCGVLFGNELIDAFPVHRVRQQNGKLEEAYVATPHPASGHPLPVGEGRAKPGVRRLVWGPPSTAKLAGYFERLGISLPDGYETEVNLAMAHWLKEAARAIETGLLILIDYGRPALEYYDPERSGGTLRAFSKHKVLSCHPRESGDPADMMDSRVRGNDNIPIDLTADVDFTSLALDGRESGFTPLAFMEMGSFLMRGLESLVQKDVSSPLEGEDEGGGGKNVARIAPHPAPSPSRGEGLKKGLRYLLHPEGLGSAFHVLILGKDINPTDWVFEHNRLSRLGLPSRSRASMPDGLRSLGIG